MMFDYGLSCNFVNDRFGAMDHVLHPLSYKFLGFESPLSVCRSDKIDSTNFKILSLFDDPFERKKFAPNLKAASLYSGRS